MTIQKRLRLRAKMTGDTKASRDALAAADRIDALEAALRTISQMPSTLPGINPDGTVSTSPMFVTLAREALESS